MNHPPIRASADREFRRVAERERDEARELLQANVDAKWRLLSECQELHRKLAEAEKLARTGWTYAVQIQRECLAAESAARFWRTVALVTLAVLVGYVVVVGIVAVSL